MFYVVIKIHSIGYKFTFFFVWKHVQNCFNILQSFYDIPLKSSIYENVLFFSKIGRKSNQPNMGNTESICDSLIRTSYFRFQRMSLSKKASSLISKLKRGTSAAEDSSDAKRVRKPPESSKYFESSATSSKTEGSSHGELDSKNNNNRLGSTFFGKPCEDLARNLLGKKFVRKMENGDIVSGVIVETEAYLGKEDKGAHSYKGKRTERNEAMYMAPGTIYVYNIYGMYTCINISSKGMSPDEYDSS